MSNSNFKVLASAWGQSLSAANMAKNMIWYMKENNFLLGEGKNSTAALRPAAVVPAPPWWICTRIQIPLSLCYNQSCRKRVATSCSTNRSNEVCKRFWALQASMSAHLQSWNNCRLWKQDNVCVAICFKKKSGWGGLTTAAHWGNSQSWGQSETRYTKSGVTGTAHT